MFKPFPLFVGLRHFRSGSDNRLVSFISLLAILGLVLGVALLIVVMSVMNGFDREMETRILGSVPHLKFTKPGGVNNWQQKQQQLASHPNVVSVSPFSQLDGMLSFRAEVQPITLRGIVTDNDSGGAYEKGETFASRFIDPMLVSRLDTAKGSELLLAIGLADKLQVSVGDRVTLLLPRAGQGGTRQLSPTIKVFLVAGIFETLTSLDQTLAVTQISTVNELAGLVDRPQGLQVQVRDLFQVRSNGYELLRLMPPGYSFTDWIQTHGNLYQAIKMSRSMVSLLVFLIIAIAVFNVVSMLVMTVVEKRSAIAILKTLGASNREIIAIFLTQGILIGVAGSLLGALLGVILALNVTAIAQGLEALLNVSFINSDIYPIDYLPSQLLWGDVLVVVVVALGLNLLATLYPAWKAARTRPAEVLRYE